MKSLRELFLQVEDEDKKPATDSSKSKEKEGDKPKKSSSSRKKDSETKKEPASAPEQEKDGMPTNSSLAQGKSSNFDKSLDAFMKVKDKPQPEQEKPKPNEPDYDFLNAVRKGLRNSDKVSTKPEPKPAAKVEPKKPEDPKVSAGDPDFLNQVKKGLSNSPTPVQRSADNIAQNFAKNNEPKKVTGSGASNIPSLASLTQVPPPLPKNPNGKPSADLPDFDNVNQEPNFDFADEPIKQAPPEPKPQSMLDKGTSILKKGAGMAVNKAKDITGKLASQMPSQSSLVGKSSPYAAKTADADAPENMSLMKSLSKQRFGKDVFADKGANWKAGDVVNIGFLKGFKVLQKKPNGWIVSRNGKKYTVIGGNLFPMGN